MACVCIGGACIDISALNVNFDTYDSLEERYYLKNEDIENKKKEYQDAKDLFKHEVGFFSGVSLNRVYRTGDKIGEVRSIGSIFNIILNHP